MVDERVPAEQPRTTISFVERDAVRMQAVRAALVRHGGWVVFVAVLALGAVAALVLRRLDPSALLYFGDSASHLVAARKMADWGEDLGLGRLGTVWLPLPHLLLLPFALSSQLFSTGLAGTAVSLPCLALASALLYKIIKAQVGAPAYVAVAGALMYALNPNILYLGLIAMTEAPFMAFFVGAAYYFQRWYSDTRRLGCLGTSAVLVALATVTRYEGWILPVFLVLAVAVRATRAGLPTGRRDACVVLALLSFTGIALWVGYNAYQYGDPLEFVNADIYSAAAQARTRPVRETFVLQPLNIARVYAVTAFVVYGPVLLATALLGLVQVVRHRARPGAGVAPVLLFLAMPPLFTLTSFVVGIGELSYWFNSRFLVLLSPLLIVLSARLVPLSRWSTARTRRLGVGVVVVWGATHALLVGLDHVPVYLDARGGFHYYLNPATVQAGEALRSSYDGGQIVIITGSGQEHRIMVTAGIPLGRYDEVLSSSTWKASYAEPWRYGRWLVLSKAPDSDAASAGEYWSGRRDELDRRYDRTYENQYFEIFRRREE